MENGAGWKAFRDVYDLGTGGVLWQLPDNGLWRPVAFSPDNALFAAAGSPGLTLWNLTNGKEIWHDTACGMVCGALTFSADGKQLAAGLSNSSIVIWDVARLTAK